MSYCRFAWDGSEVYVFENTDDKFECCGCAIAVEENGGRLSGSRTVQFDTPELMIVHLADHRRRGQFVPEYAVTGLWDDIPGADVPTREEPDEIKRAKRFMAELRQEVPE